MNEHVGTIYLVVYPQAVDLRVLPAGLHSIRKVLTSAEPWRPEFHDRTKLVYFAQPRADVTPVIDALQDHFVCAFDLSQEDPPRSLVCGDRFLTVVEQNPSAEDMFSRWRWEQVECVCEGCYVSRSDLGGEYFFQG